MFYNPIESNFLQDSDSWSASDKAETLKTFLKHTRGSIELDQFDDYKEQELYFLAPSKFKGNKVFKNNKKNKYQSILID